MSKRNFADAGKGNTSPKPEAEPKPAAPSKPVKTGLTYRPYPVDCLPMPLRELVYHGTRSIGTDEMHIAVQGWGHAAGLVNKARSVMIDSDWKLHCVFWMLSIGRSGSGKSRGFLLSNDIVFEMHKKLRAGDEQSSKEIVLTDVNSAAMKKALRKNPRGLLQANDEAGAFFGRLTQKGTGDINTEQSDYCAFFDGRKRSNRRITLESNNMDIDGMFVSMAMCLPPKDLLGVTRGQLAESGFMARFLPVYPPPRSAIIPDTPEAKLTIPKTVLEDWEQVLHNLYRMEGEHTLPLTREAWMVFRDYRRWIEPLIKAAPTEPHAAAYSRLQDYAPKFALLYHLIEEAAACELGKGKVTEKHMLAGAARCQWHLHEYDRILSMRHETDDQAWLRRLVDRIATLPNREISMRDLQRMLSHKDVELETKPLAAQIVDAGYADLAERGRQHSLWIVLKPIEPVKVEAHTEAAEPDEESSPVEAAPIEVDAELPELIPTIEAPHIRNIPIDALDLDSETAFVLKRRKLGTIGDFLDFMIASGGSLAEAVRQLDLPAESGRRIQFAIVLAGWPDAQRCDELRCGRMIGFDANETTPGRCLTCQEQGPATLPIPEANGTGTHKPSKRAKHG